MAEMLTPAPGARLDEAAVRDLRHRMRGKVLTDRDTGYDGARRVWNGLVDKRPALVAHCAAPADVAAAVLFAREHGLDPAARGGGHGINGKAVPDGGLLLDMSGLGRIDVDPVRRRVVAGAGLRLSELDKATQAHGLATTLGAVSDTGIAGLTLGGGYGWLAGLHGLACDNVLSVELVTADGEIVRASAADDPDLLWAVRGGGGNFGVVTAFEFALHPVGPVVTGGMVAYPPTKEALRFFHEFSSTCPDAVSTLGLLLTTPDGAPAVVILVCHCGSLHAAERDLAPLRAFGPPVLDTIERRQYVEMQCLVDEAWTPGRLYHWKSSLVRELGDEAIDVLLEHAARPPTASSSIFLQQLHGAAARREPDETAFPHRFDHYNCGAALATTDPADVERGVEWVRGCWEAMQPHAERGNYVNDLADEGEQRIREAYGPNYERLVAIKRDRDPQNLFRANQNIAPQS